MAAMFECEQPTLGDNVNNESRSVCVESGDSLQQMSSLSEVLLMPLNLIVFWYYFYAYKLNPF